MTTAVMLWASGDNPASIAGVKQRYGSPSVWLQGSLGLFALYGTAVILTERRRGDQLAGDCEQLHF